MQNHNPVRMGHTHNSKDACHIPRRSRNTLVPIFLNFISNPASPTAPAYATQRSSNIQFIYEWFNQTQRLSSTYQPLLNHCLEAVSEQVILGDRTGCYNLHTLLVRVLALGLEPARALEASLSSRGSGRMVEQNFQQPCSGCHWRMWEPLQRVVEESSADRMEHRTAATLV